MVCKNANTTRKRSDPVADDVQLGQLLDERPGELGAFPVAVDDGQDLVVDEVAGTPPVVALFGGELVGDAEVVGAERATDVLVHDESFSDRTRRCRAPRSAAGTRRRQGWWARPSSGRSGRRAR